MRAPEPIIGTRLVAPPAVLDGLPPWPAGSHALRLAPDEMFVLGDSRVIDPDPLLQEAEHGFFGWWLTPDELAMVRHHVEWAIPEDRPALAQGLVAGVPARLWLTEDRSLLLVAAAYAHELVERLE